METLVLVVFPGMAANLVTAAALNNMPALRLTAMTEVHHSGHLPDQVSSALAPAWHLRSMALLELRAELTASICIPINTVHLLLLLLHIVSLSVVDLGMDMMSLLHIASLSTVNLGTEMEDRLTDRVWAQDSPLLLKEGAENMGTGNIPHPAGRVTAGEPELVELQVACSVVPDVFQVRALAMELTSRGT